MDHGRTVWRNGMHKLCDPDASHPKPVVEQMAKPNRRSQVYVDYETERLNILRNEYPLAEDATEDEAAEREDVLAGEAASDVEHQWSEDVDIWKLKAKHREDRSVEIARDSLEMFGFMWQHLTPTCRLQIEERYGKPHFAGEDPKVLADAIREYLIGREVGAEGNQISVEKSRRRYQSIKQGEDQSVSSYSIHIAHEFEVLIRQEVLSNTVQYPAGTNIREEKLKRWPEHERVQHFIYGLDKVKFLDWKNDLTWKPEQNRMPQTMSEAYKQAVDWEEKWKLEPGASSKYKSSESDRERAGVYVSRIATQKKKTFRPAEFDVAGAKLCWKYRDTKSCDKGKDCPFSHKPVATGGKHGGKHGEDPMRGHVIKAAREVKFVDPDDPSAAGGGPVPKKA